jgi:F0F1-type ATP synthase membrane subunit a
LEVCIGGFSLWKVAWIFVMHWDSGRTTTEGGREGEWFFWVVLWLFFWSSCLFAPLFLSCVCVRERLSERKREIFFCDYIFECFEYSFDSILTGFGGGWCVQFLYLFCFLNFVNIFLKLFFWELGEIWIVKSGTFCKGAETFCCRGFRW